MANIAATATEPPAAARAGAASSIASKISARVSVPSAQMSSPSFWQTPQKILVVKAAAQFAASSQLVMSAGHLKRYGQSQNSTATNNFTLIQ